MRKRSEVGKSALPRTPAGHINNCSLANGEPMVDCQVCGGSCPDRAKWVTQVSPAERIGPFESMGGPLTMQPLVCPKQDPPIFSSVNQGGGPALSNDFQAIVERVFVTDSLATYNRLESILQIGEQRTDYGTLLKALDEAETNARLAHRLFISASVEAERHELDAEPVIGKMRDDATQVLQQEKDEGERRKAITDADVRAKASAMYPDEWRSILNGQARVKAMVKSMEDLAEKWSSRCRSLQVMMQSLRK